MKRRFLLAMMVMAACFIMTGCVRFDVHADIRENGNMDISVLSAANENALSSIGMDAAGIQLTDEEIEEFENEGYVYTAYEEDGYTGYTLTNENVPPEEYEGDMLTVDGNAYTIDADLFDDTELGQEDGSGVSAEFAEGIKAADGYLNFTVTLPENAEVISTNAGDISEDGRTLKWDLLETESGEVYLQYELKQNVVTEEETVYGFTDVPAGAWFAPYVKSAAEYGLMSGTGDGMFEPYGTTSRAMVVQILYAIAGRPSVDGQTVPFTDVKPGSWYYNAVVWAYNNKVTGGTGENTFSPEENVTREQIAQLLYAYRGRPDASGDLSRFADSENISGWAVNGIQWAVQNGIISGSKEGGILYLNPRNSASRAETAVMMNAFYSMIDRAIADFSCEWFDTADGRGEQLLESYRLLVGAGYTKAAACGILANAMVESGFEGTAQTGSYWGIFQIGTTGQEGQLGYYSVQNYCAGNGLDCSEPVSQVRWLIVEGMDSYTLTEYDSDGTAVSGFINQNQNEYFHWSLKQMLQSQTAQEDICGEDGCRQAAFCSELFEVVFERGVGGTDEYTYRSVFWPYSESLDCCYQVMERRKEVAADLYEAVTEAERVYR